MKKIRKIILIESDELRAYLSQQLLEDMELADEVKVIRDGWDAVQYLVANYHGKPAPISGMPDWIFINVDLQGMEGTEVLRYMEMFSIDPTALDYIAIINEAADLERLHHANLINNKPDHTSHPLQKAWLTERYSRYQHEQRIIL